MSNERRQLTDQEKTECAALKAALKAYNYARQKPERITQESVALALGMNQGSFSNYLNGNRPLNKEVAARVAGILGIPVASFSARLDKEISDLAEAAGSAGAAKEPGIDRHSAEICPPTANEARMVNSRLEAVITKIAGATSSGYLSDSDLDFLLSTAIYLERRSASSAESDSSGLQVPQRAGLRSIALEAGQTAKRLGPLDSNGSVVARVSAEDATLKPTDWDEYAFIDQYTAKAAAGSGYDNTHVVLRNTLAFKRDWLRMKGANPKNLNVIYADGESMWPTFNDRDVLLVDDSQIEPKDGGIFVLESQEQGTLVKRLIQYGDSWIIQSDNPDEDKYPDIELPDGDIYEHRITGRVIWRGGDL